MGRFFSLKRRYNVILSVVKVENGAYARLWDTSPQREALIWKDSIDGYKHTGSAAG